MARRAGISTAEKKDSQGVCFLGDISVEDFLKQYIPEKRGALVTTEGEKIGEHAGAEFYTIGQRHIDADFAFPKTGGAKNGAKERQPFYVASKDAVTNTVVVAEGSDHPALYKKELTIVNVNFIGPVVAGPVFARVRYRQPLAAAMFSRLPGGAGEATRYQLMFEKPQKFVAPGQSAVFYDADGAMLGGGVIL